MSRRIYVAAPLSEVARAREAAGVVLQLGGMVASTWHEEVHRSGADKDPLDEVSRARVVASLVRDLLRSDMLVALADQGRPRGTLVEVGYALALSRPVLWLTPHEEAERCIFDAHPRVRRVSDWVGLVRGLEAAFRTLEPRGAEPP